VKTSIEPRRASAHVRYLRSLTELRLMRRGSVAEAEFIKWSEKSSQYRHLSSARSALLSAGSRRLQDSKRRSNFSLRFCVASLWL